MYKYELCFISTGLFIRLFAWVEFSFKGKLYLFVSKIYSTNGSGPMGLGTLHKQSLT